MSKFRASVTHLRKLTVAKWVDQILFSWMQMKDNFIMSNSLLYQFELCLDLVGGILQNVDFWSFF